LPGVSPCRAVLAMTDVLTPIANKLAACIRMLSSDKDGDVVNAARGLVRMLKGVGADIHVLAERVEKSNGGVLTDAEMHKLFDAGYQAGVRAVENKQHGSGDFHNVDGTPAWTEIALFRQQNNDRLRENERTFVNDMAARSVWREPTEKQSKWLRSIFYRLGGRL
jgi:hypothetical protein